MTAPGKVAEARPAVCGIVLTAESPPRVLLAKRSPDLRFMGKYHVFPGGRIDDAETTHRVVNAASEEEARKVHAAAREVFEESGLLCCCGAEPSIDERAEWQRAVLADSGAFDELLTRLDITLDARRFEPAGRWVTPIIAPVRFDTQYFIYRHDGPDAVCHAGGEIIGLDWLTPSDARRSWLVGTLRIPPPVAYALEQLAKHGYPAALEPLRRPPDRVPGIPARLEMRCGVQLLPLRVDTIPPATHTNCVVVGDEALVVIDPAPSDREEAEHLIAQLEDMGGRVQAILLTHSHPDHVGAAERLRDRFAAPIGAHPRAAEQLSFAVDDLIEDGARIPISGNAKWLLEAIHTPGHDPGHLCFVEHTTSTLVAGDLVANPGTVVISRRMGGDMDAYLSSLGRVLEYDFKMLLPAHGLPVRNPKEKIRETIVHRLHREQMIRTAHDEGHRTMEELVARVYADTPPELWALARESLDAHLARLGLALE